MVRSEISHTGTISASTLTRILNWKSPRTKGKVDWWRYDDYAATFATATCHPDVDERLDIICTVRGMGACVGSTILHFIFPDGYPIYDVRTVETLSYLGAKMPETRSVANYHAFRDQIVGSRLDMPQMELEQIDRALFAFHKFNPQIFGAILSNGPSTHRREARRMACHR
ncbi:hypothetical protein [Cupriavidus necator]|uniref:hypothetical protein n=1 Tax=Cupriavidus necator TaxID=106590 RepID=UPI0005B3AD3F|nr:hypothetical protein [Cupriavidus necator]